jgi:hypothetical protein
VNSDSTNPTLTKGSMALTLIIATLVVLVSSLGVFVAQTYAKETKSWVVQAKGQDIANLISIPIFVGAMIFADRGPIQGLLVWLGILLFLIYAFVIYAFDVHYNGLFLAYIAVLGTSFYAFLGRMVSFDADAFRKYFSANTRVQHAISIFLVIVAVLFFIQWLSQDIPATLTNEAPADVVEINIPTNPVHVLDLGFFLPAMILTSVLLWKKRPIGHLFAVPLLVFNVFTGAGILFSNALMRQSGAAVSLIPDFIVGTVAAISILLAWLYLREMKKVPKEQAKLDR